MDRQQGLPAGLKYPLLITVADCGSVLARFFRVGKTPVHVPQASLAASFGATTSGICGVPGAAAERRGHNLMRVVGGQRPGILASLPTWKAGGSSDVEMPLLCNHIVHAGTCI